MRSSQAPARAPLDESLVDALCRDVSELPGDAREIARSRVGAIAPLLHGPARDRLVDAAVARLVGLDRLEVLFEDSSVDEVLVNSGGEIWVERDGEFERASVIPAASIPVVLERILAPLGRRLDQTNPIVDARLADGSRLCAVVPPVAVDGLALTIRRFARRPHPLPRFCGSEVAAVLGELIKRRCNLVIAGATSSGKTSLLGALTGLIPANERLLLLEDTAELVTDHPHLVRLEARPPTPDGPRAITLDDLVRTALRLRPDRLIVGEVRGTEVLALVNALNTGHDGSLTTCHANSAPEALVRLETLILQAAPTWPLAAIRAHLARSIDAVVHVVRTGTATRRIATIAEVTRIGDGQHHGGIELRDLVRDEVAIAPPDRSRR